MDRSPPQLQPPNGWGRDISALRELITEKCDGLRREHEVTRVTIHERLTDHDRRITTNADGIRDNERKIIRNSTWAASIGFFGAMLIHLLARIFLPWHKG